MPKSKKPKYYDSVSEDELADFQNSEDGYDDNSESESIEVKDISEHTGGDSLTASENTDSDSTNLENDADDDPSEDLNDDDRFDPVEEMEEPDPIESENDDEDEDNEDDVDDVDDGGNDDIEYSEGKSDVFDEESKTCHLRNLNKDFLVLDEDDSSIYAKLEYTRIPDEDRISDPILTYYELVGIIGIRAQQFNYGAEPLVSGIKGLHPARMAYIELFAKMTPFIIRRHLPCKKYEDWKIRELESIHEVKDSFFVPENFDWDALMKRAVEFQKTHNQFQKKLSKK